MWGLGAPAPLLKKTAPLCYTRLFFACNAVKGRAALYSSHEKRNERTRQNKRQTRPNKQIYHTMAKVTYQHSTAPYFSAWTLSTTSATTGGKGSSAERDNDFLTAKEAAALLRCTAGALYEAVRRQEIPHYRPFSSRILFKRGDLYKWIESRRVPEADLPY